MKKIMVVGSVLLGFVFSVSADVINSAQSGSWSDTATWSGAVPGSSDTAQIKAHTVDSSGNEGSLAGLTVDGSGAVLNMNSGSAISVLGTAGNVTLANGTMNVKSGATFTHDAAANRYIRVAINANNNGALTVSGGTVSTKSVMLMGASAGTSATATLTVDAGSLTAIGQRMKFDAGTGSTAQAFLNGGAVTVSYLEFANGAAGAQTQRFTVDGGDLTLTTGNEAGAFTFTDSGAKVMFESGSVIFEGVDTAGEFAAFQTTFNGWVDAGNVDSLALTDQNLKDGLSFNGTDAVLNVIPEPVTLGLFIVAGSALLIMRRAM